MDNSKVVDDILAHHGVKGMRWGVRRDRPSSVTVSDKGKKIKTKGGYGRPAHPDAVRARTSGQVAKKSGLKALSDDELQAYSKRIQMEQNVKRLQYNEASAPVKFVKTLLGQTGKNAAQDAANQVASSQVKKVLKRAAVAAA